jgi:hypothetical protein
VSHAPEKPTDIEVPADSLWAKLPMLGGIVAVVGLGATLGSAMGGNKDRAMFAYLFGFEFWLSIALGALGWTLIDHTVRAAWSVSVKRISETKMATLPLFALLWIPIATIGMHSLRSIWCRTGADMSQSQRSLAGSSFFCVSSESIPAQETSKPDKATSTHRLNIFIATPF